MRKEQKQKKMGRHTRHILKSLLIVPLTLAVAFGCSKYDNPDNLHFTDYGMACKYESGGSGPDYFLLRDDGATLYIKNLLWDYEKFGDGQRVKFDYEIMDNPGGTRMTASGRTYDITLYYISMIPEWAPVPLSFILEDEEHRQDSIGNDPLGEITKMYFSGNHVNLTYTYWKKQNEPHNMSLVVDDIEGTDDEITVYIRHNGNGDVPKGTESNFSRKKSEVSFSVESLVPAGRSSVSIKFVWQEYEKGKNKTWEDVEEKSETRTFSLYGNSDKQIVGNIDERAPSHYF